MSGRWLLVAAMAAEALPILRRLRRPRWHDHRLVEGELEGTPVALLRAGIGPARAFARTRAALAALEVEAVLSFGTCGGLDDALSVGTVVRADAVYAGERLVVRGRPVSGLRAADLVTVEAPVHAPAQRLRLARLAQVCEMEASAVARAAGERPFYALKVVSDRAGGDPDEGLSRRDPLAMLRFQALTLRLVDRALAPTLLALLREGAGDR